jgi:hypothetical protein
MAMEELVKQDEHTELLEETAIIETLDIIEEYFPSYLLASPTEKLKALATAEHDEFFEDKAKLEAWRYFRKLATQEQSFESLNQRFKEVLS